MEYGSLLKQSTVRLSNPIKSLLLVYEAVTTAINDQLGWCAYVVKFVWVDVDRCLFFDVDRCVLSEWVVGGGVLNGSLGEPGLPVGIH